MKLFKKLSEKQFKAEILMLVLLVITLLFTFAMVVVPNNDAVRFSNEKSATYNDSWILENTGKSLQLPCVVDAKAGEEIVISKIMTEDFSSSPMALGFLSALQSVRIEIAGKVVYEYCQNPNRYLQMQPPPAWHIIRLSSSEMGKTIRITYRSPFDRYGGVLNEFRIGTKQSIVSTIIQKNLFGLCLSLVVVITGIFSVLIYLFFKRKRQGMNELLYLGIFSMLMGVWMGCQTNSLQVLTGNVQLLYVLNYLLLMVSPLPLLLFFRDYFSGRMRIGCNWLFLFFAGFFCFSTGMQMFGVPSFFRMMPIFLMAMLFTLGYISFGMFRLFIRQREAQQLPPLLAVSLLFLFTLLDWLRYVAGLNLTHSGDTVLFMRFGVIVFLAILGSATINQMICGYLESSKVELYRALAHTDNLSGLHNRTYMMEFFPKIFQNAIRHQRYFAVIIIDIDNFKLYNDNYGHAMGDAVIRASGDILKKAVKRSLDGVIRYGGEEFLVLLPDVDPDGAKHVAERIRTEFSMANIPHHYSKDGEYLTVSQGVYSGIPTKGVGFEAYVEYADQALYQAKRSGKNRYIFFEQ